MSLDSRAVPPAPPKSQSEGGGSRPPPGALGASFHGHASEPWETCPNLTTSRNHWKAALGSVHSASQHVLCCSPFVVVQKVKQELRKGSESEDYCPLHGASDPGPCTGLSPQR